ncbi:MAG: hypothetical protein JW850_11855 [Thermoflexales bacterium]|nr:hypothetical protein [Thermoflexales bacterium]
MRAKRNESVVMAALAGVLILGTLAIVALTLARSQPASPWLSRVQHRSARYELGSSAAAMQNTWARGFRELYFSGGEPMLWRDANYTLADAIVEAKRIGFFHVHVYTNGMLGVETSVDLVWVSAAIALRMPFTREMSGWWWLYWRFYDTRISLDDLDAVLGDDAPKTRWWLRAMERAGLTVHTGGYLELTEPGAFWLHLAQNHFALNYVNTLWTRARQEPWPQAVAI